MKKRNLLHLITLLVLVFFITGCGAGSGKKYKVGINGSTSRQWEHIKKEAAKKGINLEIVYFSDYVQPNRALVDKEVDINAFQTLSFLNTFNETNKQDITPIGTTILAPMGIYSKKLKSLDELPEKAKVTIPNDPSNQGRALKLLEKAGLIKLKDSNGKIISNNDIAENPKQLEIIPLAANQLPQTLNDTEISVINNGVAV